MLVSFSTGHKYLNRHSTLRSFYYSLHVRCLFSWGRALGLFGGLSTEWLNCCLPRMEEKRESPTILVFPYQRAWQYSDGDLVNGGIEYKGVSKNHDFRPISGFFPELMQDRAIVTMEGKYETAPKLSNGTRLNDLE